VTLNKFIGRGERDSSNQAFSRCYLCDRFVASGAIIAFSAGLSLPIHWDLGLQQQCRDLVQETDADLKHLRGSAPSQICCPETTLPCPFHKQIVSALLPSVVRTPILVRFMETKKELTTA
jgi:hypothetical protein